MSVLRRVERNVLKWIGHVERLLNRVYKVTVEGNRRRGRPQKRWRDEVTVLLMGRGLSEMEGMLFSGDREACWKMMMVERSGRYYTVSLAFIKESAKTRCWRQDASLPHVTKKREK